MIRVLVCSILLCLSLGACHLVSPHVRPHQLNAVKNELNLAALINVSTTPCEPLLALRPRRSQQRLIVAQ